LKESGRIFPFFRGKIRLLQGRKHRVSVDLVVFLSRLRGLRKTSRVADLGAGFGFLSLTIAKKFGCRVFALERDPDMLQLLRENVHLNGLGGKVVPVGMDIREVEEHFERGEFDAVVTNPPFFPLRDGGYLNLLIPTFRLYDGQTPLYKQPRRRLHGGGKGASGELSVSGAKRSAVCYN